VEKTQGESEMINKILCWLFGHQEYNQLRGLGAKNHYFEAICFRCGRIRKFKKLNQPEEKS